MLIEQTLTRILLVTNQGSPELLEVKMNADGYSDGSDENNRDADNDNSIQVSVSVEYLKQKSSFDAYSCY